MFKSLMPSQNSLLLQLATQTHGFCLTIDTMEDQKDDQEQQRPVPPAPKVARLSSDSSSGVVTMAAPSPLLLGLGLGLGPGKPAFTFLQWQELQHQALIYKYMAAGIPVPLHLVLPIWKSVAAAASSSSSHSPHHYPSFMMGHGGWFMDYRNSMEPEPGRCRRTDGKKWRCSRDVVPDQKYCERHMHRGRNRSRKPVEQPASASVPVPAPATALQPSTNNHGTQLSISISSSSFQLNSNNVSPPRLGFSPTSVLHSSNKP